MRKNQRSAYDIALDRETASIVLASLEDLAAPGCLDRVDAVLGRYAPREMNFCPRMFNVLGAVARHLNPTVSDADLRYDHVKSALTELDARVLEKLSNDRRVSSHTYAGRFLYIRECILEWSREPKFTLGESLELAPYALVFSAKSREPRMIVKPKIVKYDPPGEIPENLSSMVFWKDGHRKSFWCSARYARTVERDIKVAR